jgi:hypothetical protein
MFAVLFHDQNIVLEPGQEILYRLPPMSPGPIFIDANNSYTTIGPNGALTIHSEPTSELQLELRHSNHLSLDGVNRIVTESLWQDDLWRLRVRRNQVPSDVTPEPRQYLIKAMYPSQLPVLARRIPASFFHDGFELN